MASMVTLLFAGCTSDAELQAKLDKRNASYQNMQDRRAMRTQARDERHAARFESIMQ